MTRVYISARRFGKTHLEEMQFALKHECSLDEARRIIAKHRWITAMFFYERKHHGAQS